MPQINHTLSESVNVLSRKWRFFKSLTIGPVLITPEPSFTARLATQRPAQIVMALLTFVVVTFSWGRIIVCYYRFILAEM
jgi:hypothetical protein